MYEWVPDVAFSGREQEDFLHGEHPSTLDSLCQPFRHHLMLAVLNVANQHGVDHMTSSEHLLRV